ncbi:type 1 periplasmic binding fold superfamily protein [bacterium]|nr:type 1 periplasmic binding fold superfamily protein [bacterium]
MSQFTGSSIRWICLLTVVGLLYLGCGDDNPAASDDHGPGEEELITTVTITLTETGTSNQTTVQWRDLDGPGGSVPTIGTLTLQAGTTYSGIITLLNEEENPAENITEEVEEEAEEHQFFYAAEGGISARVTVTITDRDSNNLPVGLEFTVTVSAGGAASGTLNVILYHYDEVTKDGTSPSTETDVDIDIPVNVQ